MSENKTVSIQQKEQQSLEPSSTSTALNTLFRCTDHQPHQTPHLFKKEEERTGEHISTLDGDSSERNQQNHLISNNLDVKSKCDSTPISVSSTSSYVGENKPEDTDHLQNQTQHHHHHHHYHHHYHYYSNNHQGAQKLTTAGTNCSKLTFLKVMFLVREKYLLTLFISR